MTRPRLVRTDNRTSAELNSARPTGTRKVSTRPLIRKRRTGFPLAVAWAERIREVVVNRAVTLRAATHNAGRFVEIVYRPPAKRSRYAYPPARRPTRTRAPLT
jgi:hypothetical protein